MVEHLPNHPKVKGSSTATVAGSGREKKGENVNENFQKLIETFFLGGWHVGHTIRITVTFVFGFSLSVN